MFAARRGPCCVCAALSFCIVAVRLFGWLSTSAPVEVWLAYEQGQQEPDQHEHDRHTRASRSPAVLAKSAYIRRYILK